MPPFPYVRWCSVGRYTSDGNGELGELGRFRWEALLGGTYARSPASFIFGAASVALIVDEFVRVHAGREHADLSSRDRRCALHLVRF